MKQSLLFSFCCARACIHYILSTGTHSLQIINLPLDAHHFYPSLQWPLVFDKQSRVIAASSARLTAPGLAPVVKSARVGSVLIRRGTSVTHTPINADIMAGLVPPGQVNHHKQPKTVFINRLASRGHPSIDF